MLGLKTWNLPWIILLTPMVLHSQKGLKIRWVQSLRRDGRLITGSEKWMPRTCEGWCQHGCIQDLQNSSTPYWFKYNLWKVLHSIHCLTSWEGCFFGTCPTSLTTSLSTTPLACLCTKEVISPFSLIKGLRFRVMATASLPLVICRQSFIHNCFYI